jgi:hypothetical protein
MATEQVEKEEMAMNYIGNLLGQAQLVAIHLVSCPVHANGGPQSA